MSSPPTADDRPAESNVLDRMRRQARLRPDAPAVRVDGDALTYAELDRQVTTLITRIAERQLPERSPIGVLFERDPGLPGALLAVAGAGHVAVPIDPARWVADPRGCAGQVGMRAVIVRAGDDVADAPEDLVLLHFDEHSTVPEPAAEPVPEPVTEPAAPAGSEPADGEKLFALVPTDDPAIRVGLTHRAVAALLADLTADLQLGPADRVLAPARPAVDGVLIDLLLPLTTGAELILADQDQAGELQRALDLLEESRPTVMRATPTYWRHLLSAGWSAPPELTVLSAGEAMPTRLADELAATAKAVWSLYGHPATTGYAARHRVRPGRTGATAPLGEPFSGRTLQVLNDALTPVAEEGVGQLYVERGDELYRTGDLVHRLPSGDLIPLGRAADEVIAHGMRLRPVELEQRVLEIDGVEHCAVMIQKASPGPGDQSEPDHADQSVVVLVYLVLDPDADIDDVCDDAAEALELHPVRVEFAVRPFLPTTADGRIDRAELARLRGRSAQTHEERTIAAIWADLLGVPDPPAEISFFELGGSSLVLMRLAARLQESLGLAVPVADLFESVTIEAQARLVERLYDEQLIDLMS
jgi:non-ribosomal peptide synthetase component F/acyl carrier protein